MAAPFKILYADDEPGWRELVGFWLTGAGYEHRILSAGKEVLTQAREFQPDCVLLDHDLGDVTGHEICAAIKSDAKLLGTPVILMTAHAEVMGSAAARFPPDQFIVKSDRPDELLLILGDLRGNKAG